MFLEQRGENRIERLVQASIARSNLLKFIGFAWTAGPVTYLAGQGAYYLGFGTWMPDKNLVFFIGYTVLMGFIALLVNLLYVLTRGRSMEEARDNLKRVLGVLPDLIMGVRDLSLSLMDPESRRLESAKILLQKSDLGPEWLSLAVRNIVDSPTIAMAVEETEIYWRAGMHSRIADINRELAHEIETTLDVLNQDRPQLARLLEQRLKGQKPTLLTGVERERFFIERIFSAIEEDNEDILTLSDVEEMLTLAFELLSGRRIPMLMVNYVGSWKLARATDKLEIERSKYRIARARGYSRLLALANYLSDCDYLKYGPVAEKLPSRELLVICDQVIDELAEKMLHQPNAGKQQKNSKRSLQIQFEQFSHILDLYNLASQESKRVDREHEDFVKDINQWQRLVNQHREAHPAEYDQGGRGLQIVEHTIYLEDSSKTTVVAQLAKQFDEASVRVAGARVTLQDERMESDKSVRLAKQLGIDVALALDKYVHLSRPEVQRAIYSANAIDMGGFEPGLSTHTKIGWGEAVSKEIQKNMARAAEHLAIALFRYYGIQLGEEQQEFLSERYGANTKTLEDVYSEGDEGVKLQPPTTPPKPLVIPELKYRWRKALIHFRKKL